MTLNGVMALFCVVSANSGIFRAHCVKVHVRYLIYWWVLVRFVVDLYRLYNKTNPRDRTSGRVLGYIRPFVVDRQTYSWKEVRKRYSCRCLCRSAEHLGGAHGDSQRVRRSHLVAWFCRSRRQRNDAGFHLYQRSVPAQQPCRASCCTL